MPQTISNGRLLIAYETFGNKVNPAILLIQGLGTQMLGWPEAFCQALTQQGYFVIRFDNRDVGESTILSCAGKPNLLKAYLSHSFKIPFNPAYRLEDMAVDCIALLDTLNIKTANIVGVSMGGMIAQWLAIKYPERVKTLTLLSSSSGDRGLPWPSFKVRREMMRLEKPKTRDACIAKEMRMWQTLASPAYPPCIVELRRFVSRCYDRGYHPHGTLRQLVAIMIDQKRCAQLNKISASTLVIHGEDDPMLPIANGVNIYQRIAGAQLQRIAGMGHDIPLGFVPTLVDLINTHCASYSAAKAA